MTDLERLLPAVVDLARAAGAVILRHYATDVVASTKSDKTPVTDADTDAEAVILAGLRTLTPDTPIVSEESAMPSVGRRFWLVDPLDGTREFLKRNGEFTVNIALIENERPILGVLHAPARGTTYHAHAPGSAMMVTDGGATRPIAARTPAAEGLVVLVSRSHSEKESLNQFLADMRVKDRVLCGSALKFGLIAAGEADLYVRLGRTMEWDTAAGHAVLVAAGGSVRRLDGSELLYGKPGFENPHYVARGKVP
ncbi:MAG: 3'(2'),5'-bisphosphate nucleotidase CysQ [Alphaproteobacteria bacterium]